jgi:hypothetical protein
MGEPTKELFVKKCCEMMEIDEATNLTFAGVVDLLENIYDTFKGGTLFGEEG